MRDIGHQALSVSEGRNGLGHRFPGQPAQIRQSLVSHPMADADSFRHLLSMLSGHAHKDSRQALKRRSELGAFDVLDDVIQTALTQGQHLQGQLRSSLKQLKKRLAMQNKGLTGLKCDDAGGLVPAVEQTHFTEPVARLKEEERRFLPIVMGAPHLYEARHQVEEHLHRFIGSTDVISFGIGAKLAGVGQAIQ